MVGVLIIIFVLIAASPNDVTNLLNGVFDLIKGIAAIVLILVMVANPSLILVFVVLAIIGNIAEKLKRK